MDISKIENSFIDNSIASTNNTINDKDFENKLKSAMENKDEAELKKACSEFEGILLNMLYKSMKSTVFKATLIPKDNGTEIFEDMFDDQIVEEASKRNSLGLAQQLYKQLSRQLKSDD
jgi:flagellar protein FlgJ